MSKNITKEKFIHAIENNMDNKTNLELATEHGISEAYFYQLLKKYRITKKDELKENAQRYSAEQIANLRRNASKGDTKAAAILLAIADLYEPRKQLDTQGKTQINFYISGLNVPKNAGLSDADPEAIPEQTGTAVEAEFKVIGNNQEEQPAEELKDDSQVDEESEKG